MTSYLKQRFSQNIMDTHSTHYKNEKIFENVKIELEQDKIWKQFEKIGTEMVITKNGR